MSAVTTDVAAFRVAADASDDLTLLVVRREPGTDPSATAGADPG